MKQALKRFFDGDLWYSFSHSPIVILSAVVTLVIILAATFAPWIAPHNPFDLAAIDIMDSNLPPAWNEFDGDMRFLLGTDDQGRDILSTILYGARFRCLSALPL